MDETTVETITNGDAAAVKCLLENLLKMNSNSFEFPALSSNNLRVRLWSGLYDRLKPETDETMIILFLNNLRILSRDKTDIDIVYNKEWLHLLLDFSGLSDSNRVFSDKVIIDALKCLSNLIFNSKKSHSIYTKTYMEPPIIARVQTYKANKTQYDIQYFDMRLLFISTALCSDLASTTRTENDGLLQLVDYLEYVSKNSAELDEQSLNLICEILKVLFNIMALKTPHDQTVIMVKLISICNSLFTVQFASEENRQMLHTHIVHVYTCLPHKNYPELAPVIEDNKSINEDLAFDGRNMEGIQYLIKYLEDQLIITTNVAEQHDNLSPILSVMYKAANSCSHLRRYLRTIILPPLKDVQNRPEEGDTIRNHLCRLLTTPVTDIRDLVSQFLFTLCKENVSRMVKYTGYGNAAGLFATRGLLGPDRQSSGNSRYSTDSEGSDTEEYLAMRHTVNPVTGCYEPPRVDPMAGCSDEQKEYEAMKLVNLIDQLNKAGIVQPCRIGPDGRPEPVEHVLQLQQDLPNQQVQKR